MSVTDKLKKTKKKVEETAKKKAYSEKPGAKNPAKVSDLVKMTPTKAIKGQGQTVTKSVPKAKNVTSQTQIRKQAIQKKWAQQEERARYIGLDHVLGRSPLYTLQRDNAIGRTVQDRLDYSKYLGTQKKELSDEEKREEVRERLNVIARRLKDAGQPLSSQDRKLSSRDQKLIQNAKTDYENAREQGNRALMEAAHKRAENIRKGYGYSGGTTGEDYISPDLSKEEIAMLTPEGQRRLKRAKMDLETAQKSGDERKIAEVEAAVARIIGNNANRKEGFKKVDGYEGGNGQPRSKEPIMSYQDWEDRAYEGVYSVMSAVPGSILSLVETSNQAIENDFREKNWDYINDKANRLYEYKAMLELAKKGDGNPEWGTVAQLEQQVRIAEIAEKMRSVGTTVDPNLPGQTFMRKSMEAQQKFMEGRTGVDKLLASAALSMGQMAPALAISAIPGVGPAVGAGIMGAQAAGSKAYELNERGVDPAESQLRGIVSGGIESLTEKIPISNLLKVVKAGGGASLLKTMAKQAGIEATEESISYAMNYAADVAYKDPEAKFSVKDLLESAAVGAISGGALSGGGALLGRAVTRNAGASGQAVTPVRQSQEETRADTERQIRDQAAAMLTDEATVPETVRQTERATQQDVPVAEILKRAPVSGNVQQEMRNEAQTASSSQKAVPAKTVNPTRIEVREQAGSPVMEPNSQVRQVLGQAQTSMLTRMANTLGDSGSKAIMAAWDNNGNPGQYAADFVRVYNRALSGTTVGRIQAPASLTDAQVMAAYTAGQNDRMASLEQEKVNAKQAEVAGRNTAVYATVDGSEAGLVYDDYVRDVMDRDTAESVTTVAKQLGLRVQMVDSVAGGMANADIQGSVVQIEKNNPNPVRSLFGHEMTHRVQQLAPESYRAFRDYVMQSEKAQEDVQRKITEYKKAGVELSREAAMDEITADYAGEMIEDQNLLKRFIENNRSNRSLLRRFLNAVKDMARKLTGSYQKQANDAAALLEKAVEDASKQAGKLQANKNTAGKGGVRYSIRKEFASEVQEWYENGMQQDERFTIGSTGPVLQGLGAIESDIYTDGNKIKTIFEEHPEMGVREIKRIPEILENPVLILKSRNVGRNPKGNNRLVLFGSIKAKDGRPIMCVLDLRPTENGFLLDDMQKVNSAYTKDVKPVEFVRASSVLHADKKRTIPLLRSIGFKMPIALLRDGSVGSIFYSGTNVNIHGVPFGEVISENEKLFDDVGVSYDAETESASPARFSPKTWNSSGYVTKREEAAKSLADAMNISQKKAKQYIDDVNSIAKMIADDKMRLDYEASPGRSSFISNAEYGGSIDFSTICKKRRLFTGTFEAIQEALPNTALTAEEFLEIRSMMAEKGYEVSCGLCYVEGSLANMGQYTKQFIERYAATNPEYVPNMAEMNTASGQEKLRKDHPEVYEAYEYFMNHYGRLKPGDKALFASQQKPKMYQMATEYQGEILKKFGKKNSSVENKNANGGLRLQSFSDFEIIHLIDSMQVIMDMSRVGLAGQAYTKVPDFAWALGDTGLKINLSLIAKGVDGNGRLVLDEVEGMAEADAMALRERYSDNVGTVLVAFTDRQLLAAMADERIDFIIPFHRSQWKTDQYEAMGLPANAKDFTLWQNEAYIEPVYNASGKKQRPSNYMPNNYWNFRKSGKKNAEAYLKMCAENNRRPKFHYLLDKNKDGSYSLKKDGSTDGYWKLLIDFKMYNNDGKGVPQRPVRPDFNMEQAERMLNEYSGGHSKFPAAQDVVDEFVTKYKQGKPEGTKFSLKGSDDYQGLIEKYGAMEQGENPRARDVQVPSQTADGKKVSRTVRTVMEAAATPEDMVPTIQEMVEKGEFSYEVAGDKAAIQAAEATIRDKGFQASLMDWTSELASGKISKQNVADGWALYNAAAQAGDTKTAADILTRIVQHQRNAAQAVQATRILKKMSPGAQLYGIQRSVQNMQAELQSKYGDKAPDLKIPDELVEQYLNADTKEARDEAEKEMYTAIGKQMPSTFKDKWNSWRYLAMLFNVRTHIRNVSGNAFFALPVMVKNFVGTGLEGVGSAVSGGKMQKTKGLYGPELFKAAWKDYQNAKPQIMAGGKYDDSVAKRDAIEGGRRIFRIKFLEGIRKFNSWALEVEDSWFAKPHYANALAQYCASNKITAEQIQTGDGLSQADLDKARAYAIQEAQKATYRDFNQFSDFISGVGRYSGDNTVKKAFSSMVEGVLPFRKTPANILVRAVEYSPAGLVSGIWELTYGVKTGKNTAAEALDRLSAGLTGSGLFALGVYLASQGLLIASGDDDDKQKDFDKLLGRQDYSIELRDGTNFTIDWLAPECIPVFMGAEYFKAMADREDTGAFSLTMFLDAMSKVTNPMLEMSCLSSLNDLFDNLSGFKSGDVSSLVVVAANMAVSYLTQGVPTLFGQGERASQEERMTTYTDKNKDLPPDWQYTLGKLSGRIPGWDYGQIPFIDAWGRTENEGSTAERLLNNFINPAYMSQYKVSKLEAELQRLYDATGESVLPQRADRSITVNGEDVYLTAEQYITYATQKGTRAQSLLQEIISSSWYADMDDAAKAKIITDALAVANEGAKLSVFPDYVSKNKAFLDASAMEGDGVPVGTFLMLSGIANAQEGVKNADGVTISDSASYNKFKALRDSVVMDNLSAAQKEKVYDALEISSKVRSMNESALNQLGQDIEAKKNEPSVFSVLGEDKTDFVKEFYDTCDSFSSSYDGNGKPIKGQGKQDKIIAEINKYSNLTRKEKSSLYHMFYESDRNNPWA